mmetsp:Transcript_8116/g.19633  ORF Transcript_8116/g.19633 Transcript_8116/m.19633 type:complete len:206 (-) Transcript_8116:1512-2129(-)
MTSQMYCLLLLPPFCPLRGWAIVGGGVSRRRVGVMVLHPVKSVRFPLSIALSATLVALFSPAALVAVPPAAPSGRSPLRVEFLVLVVIKSFLRVDDGTLVLGRQAPPNPTVDHLPGRMQQKLPRRGIACRNLERLPQFRQPELHVFPPALVLLALFHHVEDVVPGLEAHPRDGDPVSVVRGHVMVQKNVLEVLRAPAPVDLQREH